MGDFNTETGELLVRRGKGAKSRTAYVAGGAAAALETWISVRGESEGPLLFPYNRGGKIATRRLSAQTVRDLLDKRAKQAGLQALSPHDLRRSFISELLEAGADLSVEPQLAGHASVATTTRYDRRGEKA